MKMGGNQWLLQQILKKTAAEIRSLPNVNASPLLFKTVSKPILGLVRDCSYHQMSPSNSEFRKFYHFLDLSIIQIRPLLWIGCALSPEGWFAGSSVPIVVMWKAMGPLRGSTQWDSFRSLGIYLRMLISWHELLKEQVWLLSSLWLPDSQWPFIAPCVVDIVLSITMR